MMFSLMKMKYYFCSGVYYLCECMSLGVGGGWTLALGLQAVVSHSRCLMGTKMLVHSRPGRQWLWPKAGLPLQLGAQSAFLPYISFPCLAERKTCSWPQCPFYPVDCPCHTAPFRGLLRHTATCPHQPLMIVASGPLILSRHASIYPFCVH